MAGRLEAAIAGFERAAEEVANAAAVAAFEGRSFSKKHARDMQDRLLEGQLNGARAERKVMDMRSVAAHREMLLGGK